MSSREPLFYYCPHCPSPYNAFDSAEECRQHVLNAHRDEFSGGELPVASTIPRSESSREPPSSITRVGRALKTSHAEPQSAEQPLDDIGMKSVEEGSLHRQCAALPTGQMVKTNKQFDYKSSVWICMFILVVFILIPGQMLPSASAGRFQLRSATSIKSTIDISESSRSDGIATLDERMLVQGNEDLMESGHDELHTAELQTSADADKVAPIPEASAGDTSPPPSAKQEAAAEICRDKQSAEQCGTVACCPGGAGGPQCGGSDCSFDSVSNTYSCPGSWMKQNCAASCGLCEVCNRDDVYVERCIGILECCPGGSGSPACGDGDCVLNGDAKSYSCPGKWMKENCAHACKLCSFRS
eukprot:TRINITY_DN53838_c0_g1_i1.p1 TRINITY_DN53838_c0_g1~~TRINITY_DN53838_c0_g1_i1.p1  ORF type:complete len:356 (-),score=46.65 TRINITY_DN53838_c0_g1_i1:255-1322(-)